MAEAPAARYQVVFRNRSRIAAERVLRLRDVGRDARLSRPALQQLCQPTQRPTEEQRIQPPGEQKPVEEQVAEQQTETPSAEPF